MRYIRNVKFPFRTPYDDEDRLAKLKEIAKASINDQSMGQADLNLLKSWGVTEFHGYEGNYGIDLPADWVSDYARAFFNKMGYAVVGAEYFYFSPGYKMDIHIDGAQYCRKAKFNWAWGGDHIFEFFEPLEQGNRDDVAISGSAYSWGFTEEQVELKEAAPMGLPSLVCVGVPHRVTNGPEPLELFNICIWKKGLKREDDDFGGMDMEDAEKDFHEYLL